ncbi:glycoside hydrolase family 65 protein [Pseudonocardia hydrocarbonoxydans]|uniref:Trehalose 6-phosphate phosphorylase n=1 Tax=Pseudonocardia hydrocarbonoxydans TaxID=76726 RepID=A0A4Y3WPT1_9PSEU|nr:glycosyl hydrolase family 65 protein [Pseudonocardia hydrocarbonoxydans]GEC20080.1 trehalose 6-phosphate phosphorylase [Pseudonocardia hydrocarbonoxydans]
MDAWTWVLEGWDPADEGRREALTTLGNGRFATRGAAPESRADGVHYPGTYAAGVFDRARDEIGGEVVESESMVNLPHWADLRVAADDGPWIGAGPAEVREHRVTLDLRRGLLVRRTRFVDDGGRVTTVHQRRFVHRVLPHVAALHTEVTAENWSGRLRISSGVDGGVTNAGVARYAALEGRHLDVVETGEPDPSTVLLVARTRQSRVRVAVAARTRLHPGVDGGGRTLHREPARVSHLLDLPVQAGEPVAVEKVVALVTSRDPAVSEPAVAAAALVADAAGFDELLAGHELAWRQLWRRYRLDLSRPAAPATLRTLRLCVFHVLQAVSEHNRDLDAGVPARGLHGEAYRGHVFWDELFVYPMLTLRAPAVTQALLGYRVRRLGAARRAARAAGLPGAMYPWQSGSDGREESQRRHLNPRSGRWIPDTSHLQRHVGLAVAHSIWQYYQGTGDREFLADHGAEVVLEVARFFGALARHDPATDRFHIRGVMGPDEYSTRYPGSDRPGIDDNAYTNVMTVWLLRRAEDVLAALEPIRRTELVESLDLGPAERSHWQEVARRMFVPIAADGVIDQYAGARELPDLDLAAYRARYGDLSRLDRILEAEGRSVDDYRVSKQADVLMLFYLLSADELRDLLGGLGYGLPPEAIPATIEYHLSRTVHGSTLSALVHAWVLARGHREHAVEYFERALASDVADIQRGTTAEGVHLGAMAGCVDLLQRCFAGLETRHDALWFDPHWPRRFGRLVFTVQYRHHQLTVEVGGRSVRVVSEPGPGPPIRVGSGDRLVDLRPGGSVVFPAHPVTDGGGPDGGGPDGRRGGRRAARRP